MAVADSDAVMQLKKFLGFVSDLKKVFVVGAGMGDVLMRG